MKIPFWRELALLMLLPAFAGAASPARSEYEAALRATPDYEHGAVLFAQCVACHGAEGQGLPDGSTPRIAGQNFHVIVKQLVDFRYGKRWDSRMEQRANNHLGAFQDIADVASYLSQQPRAIGSADSVASTGGASLYATNCANCHGAQGEGDDAQAVPMLAGQHAAYLLRQLTEAAEARRPALTQLHAQRVKALDAEQLQAIANFLSKMGTAN